MLCFIPGMVHAGQASPRHSDAAAAAAAAAAAPEQAADVSRRHPAVGTAAAGLVRVVASSHAGFATLISHV